MDSKASSTILFLSLLCLFSTTTTTTHAFNITKILSNYPDFSTFNNLLNETGLAQQINSRQTITVLVISNSIASSLSSKPLDVTKRILSTHIILDYYDSLKLSKLQKKSNILTTLYQTTGIANDQQGFVNVTKTENGIMFGSAMKGAPLMASLVGSVMSQPYNISILQVNGIIEAPGIENMTPPPPPIAGAPKKAPATISPPSPSEEAGDDEEAEAPSGTPSEAPAPAEADDAPVSSPPQPEEVADAPVDKKNGSSRVVGGGLAVLVVGLVSYVLGF